MQHIFRCITLTFDTKKLIETRDLHYMLVIKLKDKKLREKKMIVRSKISN